MAEVITVDIASVQSQREFNLLFQRCIVNTMRFLEKCYDEKSTTSAEPRNFVKARRSLTRKVKPEIKEELLEKTMLDREVKRKLIEATKSTEACLAEKQPKAPKKKGKPKKTLEEVTTEASSAAKETVRNEEAISTSTERLEEVPAEASVAAKETELNEATKKLLSIDQYRAKRKIPPPPSPDSKKTRGMA